MVLLKPRKQKTSQLVHNLPHQQVVNQAVEKLMVLQFELVLSFSIWCLDPSKNISAYSRKNTYSCETRETIIIIIIIRKTKIYMESNAIFIFLNFFYDFFFKSIFTMVENLGKTISLNRCWYLIYNDRCWKVTVTPNFTLVDINL
jgi:hypothetical protein